MAVIETPAPISLEYRFDAPGELPASRAYDVAPGDPVHVSVNVVPPTQLRRFVGAAGTAHDWPTTSSTSLPGALRPAPLRARTRTKYEPNGTLLTDSEGRALPVSKLATFESPVAEPASTT